MGLFVRLIPRLRPASGVSRQQLVQVEKKKGKKKLKVKTEQKEKYDAIPTGRIHERKCFVCGEMLAVLIKTIGWRKEVSFMHTKDLRWAARRRQMEILESSEIGKRIKERERDHYKFRSPPVRRRVEVPIRYLKVPAGAIVIGETMTGYPIIAYPKKK